MKKDKIKNDNNVEFAREESVNRPNARGYERKRVSEFGNERTQTTRNARNARNTTNTSNVEFGKEEDFKDFKDLDCPDCDK